MSRSRRGRHSNKNDRKKILWAVFAVGVTIGALCLVFYRAAEIAPSRVKKPAYAKKAPPVLKRAQKEQPAPVFKVAIVLDDFGYNYKNVDTLLNIKRPITFSILPNLPYSKTIARKVSQERLEGILHLPMEARKEDKHVKTEAGTIMTAMDKEKVLARLAKAIESIPGLKGISNHQGSKATEDQALMTIIFAELKKRNLYFLDSLVTDKSVCKKAARSAGIKFASRDVFLDNQEDFEYIRGQMKQLIKSAKKTGFAIGIGHDRVNTVSALARLMPEAEKEGIKFVLLSELVR